MFDRSNPDDLDALFVEVTTDPNSYGYNPRGNTQRDILDPINQLRREFTIERSVVEATYVINRTPRAQFEALGDPEREWLVWQVTARTLTDQGEGQNLPATEELLEQLYGKGGATSIWSPGDRTMMHTIMQDIFVREASRAEDLFGVDTIIDANDWAAARKHGTSTQQTKGK